VLFVINYRADLTTRHILRFRGVDYDITRIDDLQGYKQDLTVWAKKKL
jgi:hypothetical protein